MQNCRLTESLDRLPRRDGLDRKAFVLKHSAKRVANAGLVVNY